MKGRSAAPWILSEPLGSVGVRVVFVSREVWPFVQGGGIGRYVSDAAAALAEHADVTILTSDRFEPQFRELEAADDPRLGRVRWHFAPEPTGDLSPFWTSQHAWSATVCGALRELCAAEPPDLVEFEDYGGAAAVTLHAARSGDPAFRDVRLVVRAHTSWEMTQVLDGSPLDGLHARTVMALEREGLRLADLITGPAGALAAYERHYGADALGPTLDCPPPFHTPSAAPGAADPPAGGPLRLLYIGRMQALKGTEELVRALRALDRDDVELTLVGGDTETGPDRRSMAAWLRRIAEDDPRIHFLPQADRDRLVTLLGEHHVVVVPSRFESFSYVVREALAANRPVLAADVGGVSTDFVPGRSGWLFARATPEVLAARIAELASDRNSIDALIREGAPRATLDAAASVPRYVAAMTEIAGRPPRHEPERADVGTVRAIITAFAGDGALADTLDSLAAQRAPAIDIVVVARDLDQVPAATLNRFHELVLLDDETVTAARRAGLAATRGTGPVLLLRAGERLRPDFLERALAVLRHDARIPYVTAYADGRTPGCVPLGNAAARFVGEYDVAASVALLRDGLSELPDPLDLGRDDQALFDGLAHDGRFGVVIPEYLVERRSPTRPGAPGHARVWRALARDRL